MDSQNIMNDLTIKSGKNTQIILNGNPVINGMALKPGINMLLFDKYMKKSVLWNYNHTDTNMTQRFLHIMNILPKNLYCIITVKGDINKVMNKFVKDYLKQKLNAKYLDNLVNFSAWALLFYNDNDGYVNVREAHDVNQQVNMYLTIHSNPIATREEAIKQELENTLDNNQEDIESVETNIAMNIQKVAPAPAPAESVTDESAETAPVEPEEAPTPAESVTDEPVETAPVEPEEAPTPAESVTDESAETAPVEPEEAPTPAESVTDESAETAPVETEETPVQTEDEPAETEEVPVESVTDEPVETPVQTEDEPAESVTDEPVETPVQTEDEPAESVTDEPVETEVESEEVQVETEVTETTTSD
jgi:hypothetical protein